MTDSCCVQYLLAEMIFFFKWVFQLIEIACQLTVVLSNNLSMNMFFQSCTPISTYFEVTGIPKLPDITAVTRVDKLEVHYYYSNSKKRIPKQPWMKTAEFKDFWKQMNAYHDEVYNKLKKYFDLIKKNYNKTGMSFFLFSNNTVYVICIIFTDNKNKKTIELNCCITKCFFFFFYSFTH